MSAFTRAGENGRLTLAVPAKGRMAETTLRRNYDGFGDWWLANRVLRQNAGVSIATEVLGTPIDLPVMIAPTGGSSLFWPRGEEEAARAAHDRGTVESQRTPIAAAKTRTTVGVGGRVMKSAMTAALER